MKVRTKWQQDIFISPCPKHVWYFNAFASQHMVVMALMNKMLLQVSIL
jgi:hypothetical protein